MADPDEAQPGRVLPGKRLPAGVYVLPVEEARLAEDRVVAELVWLNAAMRLQPLVSVHVLPHARRGLQPLCWETGEE